MAKDQHNLMDVVDGGLLPPAGVRLVQTEQVLLLAVTLPQMPTSQRRVAVAFAVEDQIARPLDDVHVVLGPQIGTAWLVVVVARDALAALPHGRLVPDVFMVPVPAEGEWSVWAQGTRMLVRCADGTGFATSEQALGIFHLAAGRPGLVLYGGELPDGFVPLRRDVLPATDARFARFDLNSARVQSYATRLPRGLRGFALLVVAATVGHLALLGADAVTLMRLRDDRAAAVRLAAGLADGANIEAVVAQAMVVQQPGERGAFLPQSSTVFAAMNAQTGEVTVRDLRYLASAGSIVMTLEARDIATLQGVETALNSAGLTVTSGAVTSGNGLAEQQLTITGHVP